MNNIFSNAESRNALLERVLLEPMESCDELRIITGYASSSMLKRHLDYIQNPDNGIQKDIKIRLLIGMVPSNGITIVEHRAYQKMVKENNNVMCSYAMINRKPFHSKVYIWLSSGVPKRAFIGSANYSQNAFFGDQVESVTECDPTSALELFEILEKDTAYCNHDEIEDMVHIGSEKDLKKKVKQFEERSDNKLIVTLPLTDKNGDTGMGSKLNWGQRKGREPNQAYIPIPAGIGRSGFFPKKGEVFTVMTDDGFVFQCVTAQNTKGVHGKAIETCENNSELGLYFRNRLGVKSGNPVTKEDLERYGRDDVEFINLQDGTYYMNFSRRKSRTPKEEKIDILEDTDLETRQTTL